MKGKTVLITGASRGIGKAIAQRLAESGANLVVISKDREEAFKETESSITSVGPKPLLLNVDVSDFEMLKHAVSQAHHQFGSIDILVNNTSATYFQNAENLTPQQFDLMMATSVRAAFFLSQLCIPYLKESPNPHIVNISPPLNIDPVWFKAHLGFSISKYAMSMCSLGMAEEFKEDKIAVNALWPKSTIATQTIKDHFSAQVYSGSRNPSIMADAALELVKRDSSRFTGNFYLDEEILRESGIENFSQYAIQPNTPLMQALFIPPDASMVPVSQDMFIKKDNFQV